MDHFFLLLIWGVMVGVDLASFPQIMIARPIVAGSVAGLLLGDPISGIQLAIIFELFALDVMPVGAARYPDYGPATVAAVYVAAGSPGILGIGIATLIGLATAFVGGTGMRIVRRLNTYDVQSHRNRLDNGDSRAVYGITFRGLMRDALRALIVTGIGLAFGYGTRRWLSVDVTTAVLVSIVGIGSALAAGTSGAIKITGRGSGAVSWIGLGALAGLALVVIK